MATRVGGVDFVEGVVGSGVEAGKVETWAQEVDVLLELVGKEYGLRVVAHPPAKCKRRGTG